MVAEQRNTLLLPARILKQTFRVWGCLSGETRSKPILISTGFPDSILGSILESPDLLKVPPSWLEVSDKGRSKYPTPAVEGPDLIYLLVVEGRKLWKRN